MLPFDDLEKWISEGKALNSETNDMSILTQLTTKLFLPLKTINACSTNLKTGSGYYLFELNSFRLQNEFKSRLTACKANACLMQ